MSLTRHFCCCLSVRLGVFVLSLLSLVGGIIYAGAVWYAYYRSTQVGHVSLTTTQNIAFIASGVMYTTLAIAALLGLIGAIGRMRGLVATYSTFMWFQLAAQVIVGAFFIYSLFQNNSDLVNQCQEQVNRVNDAATAANPNSPIVNPEDACTIFTNLDRIGAIMSFIVLLLIDLYCCFIVSRYVEQLTDEQVFHTITRHSRAETNVGRRSTSYAHKILGTEMSSKGMDDYVRSKPHHSFEHKV